jgi:hypothetical protein
MPSAGFEPAILATALEHAATETGPLLLYDQTPREYKFKAERTHPAVLYI